MASGAHAPGADDLGYPEDQQGSRPSTAHTAPPGSSSGKPEAKAQSQTSAREPRRQRRRLDELGEHDGAQRSPSTASSHSPMRRAAADESMEETEESGEGEDEIAVAIGQLSINEDEQVRFHGKASGLHMLGVKERQDGRNEGGIWRFPKARVWPPLPPAVRNSQRRAADEFAPRLPDVPTQELLLDLYFTYVHPALPIVHKRTFLEDFRSG